MFTTTVSEIKEFWACPTRWYLKYVYPRRTPNGVSAPLTIGTAWHHFMEKLFNGTDREQALQEMWNEIDEIVLASANEGFSDLAHKLSNEREKLMVAGKLWNDWLDCETLAVEKPLELLIPANEFGEKVPFEDVVIQGKPDRVVRLKHNGKLMHFQHKTIAGSKPVQPYLDTFHRQAHEGAYWWMIRNEYQEEPDGVVLNLMRKLSIKTITESPQSAIQQHMIPITKLQAFNTVRNLARTVNAMRSCKIFPSHFLYDVPDLDMGRYGNSVDPYFEYLSTLDESALENEARFKPTENRYAAVETEEV